MGGKTAIWDREEESLLEREREKERHREIRQIKLFSVERHQSGTERKGDREKEKERHKEIRQIKLFGVQRHQFGTERKGEREREKRETQRDTSLLGENLYVINKNNLYVVNKKNVYVVKEFLFFLRS